ncbi:hypothetical protein BOTCAL_0487g00040 [Botryotinia calthae]|uniref:Uncharacterized protein n=1 Tax=Botryotinia calthae TaxID=38488 RepID=A0A4Y8CLT5_9HELO|nr:hypothetical protein BOTCAL_0487g00040 [Botryotinia calthae]
MARINSLNNLIYLIFFSVLHLTEASKPSIKTVTVNPCTFTPTTPTYISPSSPCPTVTISTSHTSCPPTTPTSCSQNFCISDAFITVPCTCPYSVPTTTLYTPCPSACSQTCYIGHQIYHETSCPTTIAGSPTPSTTPTPIIDPPTSLTIPTGGSTICSCPYYPPYPTYCNPPCPVHTPTSTSTSTLSITTQTLPTTTTNLVTCSCPYYPPYPTNCIFPCPIHTPTTVITVPTTTIITSAPSCESITITRGDSCAPIVGGPYCKTTCDGACGTEWQTVALPCPTIPMGLEV